jgi:hypothetical protein
MLSLSPRFNVPANASRFFKDYSEAVSQPEGTAHLAWDQVDEIIINKEYNAELIKFDSQYCTTVASIGTNYTIPTFDYFEKVLRLIDESPRVVDIGCGQGEFVLELRKRQINAIGYDPVLRSSSSFLHSKLWEPSEEPGNLYVMRCVLPHIQNPWNFLSQIFESAPHAKVLIEFQRIEWILDQQLWYQISHDHVNLFSLNDFDKRYKVFGSGTFSNGEWGWVLISQKDFNSDHLERAIPKSYPASFTELFMKRELFLRNLSRINQPIAIWGAAGKGIVLAHAVVKKIEKILAIDADSNRWGHFLEASGVEVLAPGALHSLDKETLILVCNPNHFIQVKQFIGNGFEVTTPGEIFKK